MKKITGSIMFACLLIFAQAANAQVVEDIINKHVAAMGGKEKIQSLNTAVMTGTFTAPGATPISIVATKKHITGSRIDIDVNGVINYQMINNENGWIFTPIQGDQAPRTLAEDQVKVGQVQLDLHGPFINTKEKGIVIVSDGKDTVNGQPCNKLKVTFPNKNTTVYSIDVKNNLVVKTSTKMFQFGAYEDVATTYDDYKQNADGYWFAYSNTSPRGVTRYEKIDTNVPVDKDLFIIK